MKKYLITLVFEVEADSIESAIDQGSHILECAQDKGRLLRGEASSPNGGERFYWGTLDNMPFSASETTATAAVPAG